MFLALFFVSYTASVFANIPLDRHWGSTGFALVVGTIIRTIMFVCFNQFDIQDVSQCSEKYFCCDKFECPDHNSNIFKKY